MAFSRILAPVRALDKGTVLLQATIAGNGTPANIALESGTGKGMTFTRNDVGDYTLSLGGTGTVDIQSVLCTFEGSTRKAVWCGGRTAASGGSVDILVETPSTEAVAAAAADLGASEAAHIFVWVKHSSVA